MLTDILFFLGAAVIVFALYKVIFKSKPAQTAQGTAKEEKREAPEPLEEHVEDNRNRNARNVRNRFARNQNVNLNQDAEEEKTNNDQRNAAVDSDDDENDDPTDLKKQQMKEAKRQQKKEQQEAWKRQLEEKEKQANAKRNKYEERERQREEEERKQEEIVKQLEEEQRKKEEEEYNKWKDMFSVDEAGKETDNAGDEENLLQKFVDYIKLRKVVMLDDLCAEFKLSTKDVIDRINKLIEAGKLSGIIDDRGKFIYITDEEFKNVMNFIKRRGRISRMDLVLECNRLIKMNPSEEDKKKLKSEESKLLNQLESDLQAVGEQTA